MAAVTVKGQVFLLATAQALFQTASVMVMTIGGLAGGQIASRPELATMPVAAMFLGTAITMLPASLWMARIGRKTGFIAGALLGTSGGLLAAFGLWQSSLLLLSLGTFLVGSYQAFAQFYRFAAGEIADDAYRSRAISLVLGGGVVAALAGPLLAQAGGKLMVPPYMASFLLLALVSLIAAGILSRLHSPAPSAPTTTVQSGRTWREIVTQPAYLVALFAAATGYGIMILAMTATPIAMGHHQHEPSASTMVIQLHVLGMFLPSFFTGSLIARFGVMRIMMTGLALFGAHVALALTGTGFVSFASALIMLGIGWNFLYIGGTTLLTTTYTSAEKGRAQATNDLTIFIVGLTCSFSAGGLLQYFRWQTLNMLLIPWIIIAVFVLLRFSSHYKRAVTSHRIG
ncbi:MFS transporter [Bacillus subtilis]|uniref:MFS transporter n=1 Tax=Pseudochrobactrum asaccharolyticum TaxID=354351 RepID=UPI001F01180C|nr:MFS transporter [Pseudochrobactrum asaccharolyticum]MCF7646769.1 MFS transporter [Pseudochrobactrum asaccharolyticum]MCF7672594.1 MFS transporter [Bacillus subtilis]